MANFLYGKKTVLLQNIFLLNEECYQVRIINKGIESSKCFNFSRFKTRKNALLAAKNWRDAFYILNKIKPVEMKNIYRINKVGYQVRVFRNDQQRSKLFSFSKHGDCDSGALSAAKKWRDRLYGEMQ